MLISYMYTFQRGGNVAFQKGKKEKEKKNAQDSGVVLVCLRVAARQVKHLPQRAPVKRGRPRPGRQDRIALDLAVRA